MSRWCRACVGARRAAAAQKAADRRAEPSQPSSRTISPQRDVAMLRQFAAHVAVGARQRAAVRAQQLDAEAFETLAEIGRDVASRPRPRRAVRAHRAVDAARHRLPDVRHPAARTTTGELEMKLARAVRREASTCRACRSARARRLRGAAPRAGARRRRVAGPALHQGRAGRAVGARDPDDAEGSLHRRARPREPRARRLHEA